MVNSLPQIPWYKTMMVTEIFPSTPEEREKWISECHYNLFGLRSKQVVIDLMTDSGTNAMSNEQWAAMFRGDESYSGSASFYRMKDVITKLTGFPYVIPCHQGRAAEKLIFPLLIRPGDFIPTNILFDTTIGHTHLCGGEAIDCIIDEASDISSPHPFKGNLDIQKLSDAFKKYSDRIPYVLITITCNSAGGQPVSMQNLKYVYTLAKQYGKMVIFDSARFTENAYFIQQRDSKYADKSIQEIVLEMFKYCDIMLMSAKKDASVNMGGFIALNNESLYKELQSQCIINEGFFEYGGMTGREMESIAQGLLENAKRFPYLDARINQVAYLGQLLVNAGIPVQQPFGGHAIYVDGRKFFSRIPNEQFPAQTLAIELYKISGVRAVEIGNLVQDKNLDGSYNFPQFDWVRLAIPRKVYSREHMEYVAAALIALYERRDEFTTGYQIIEEVECMRHFTVKLEKV